jgi:sensor histidine kinase YesM
LLFWTVIAAVHILFLERQFDFPLTVILSDGIFYNYTFAIFGLGLWYLVRYSNWDEKDALFIAVNLVAGAILIIAFWLSMNETLLSFLYSDNPEYIEFSENNRFWRISIGFFFYALIVMLYYLVIYYGRLQEQKRLEAELQRNIVETRLNLIRNQINPHFLFNSLNSISALTLNDGEKAREMIRKLSDFLRFSLSRRPEDLITLKEELETVQQYIDLEKVRFGDKMTISFNIEETLLDKKVPNLLLQPLFENIVKYAVQESVGATKIELEIKKEGDNINIELINSLESDAVPKKAGTGFGQKQLAERLGLIYKDKARCSFHKNEQNYIVSLDIPLKV